MKIDHVFNLPSNSESKYDNLWELSSNEGPDSHASDHRNNGATWLDLLQEEDGNVVVKNSMEDEGSTNQNLKFNYRGDVSIKATNSITASNNESLAATNSSVKAVKDSCNTQQYKHLLWNFIENTNEENIIFQVGVEPNNIGPKLGDSSLDRPPFQGLKLVANEKDDHVCVGPSVIRPKSSDCSLDGLPS